jgi:hypothetical protein
MKQLIITICLLVSSLIGVSQSPLTAYLNLTEKEVKDKFKEEGFRFDKETIEICVKPDKTCKVFIAQSDTEIIKCRFEESKGICNAVIRYKK